MMPFGLRRNTRPFDCRAPRISDGLTPTTRFKTELAADCWTKRVISFWAIEKFCQLMIEPGLLVMVSRLPLVLNTTLPLTTEKPDGLAVAEAEISAVTQRAKEAA